MITGTMLVFVALAIAGFLLVGGAFLFGHDVDHDFDHGDLGHDFCHDLGHDASHGDGVSHGDEGHEHAISIFSTKVIATFVMGFGAAGAIAQSMGYDVVVSSCIGIGSGVVFGTIMYSLMNFFVQQQGTSVVKPTDLIGLSGQVTVDISPGQLGEVGVRTNRGYYNFAARSRCSFALKKGETVRVIEAPSSTLVVELLA